MTDIDDSTNTAKPQTIVCDLCGKKISGEPVNKSYNGQEKHFCCQGCCRVYDTAHETELLDQIAQDATPPHKKLTDLILDRGETTQLSVKGMWCAGCAVAAERVIRKQPGVKDVQVNFASEQGRVQYDPNRTDLDTILEKINRLGYQARILSDVQEKDAEKQQESLLLQLLVSAAFGMQIMVLYLVQLYPLYATGQFDDPNLRRLQYLVWILATPVMFIGGLSFLRGAYRAMLARTATMDTLVALGTLSAYTYSAYITIVGGGEVYFDSVAMITTFILLGRYLEKIGGAQARKDIRKLLQLQPKNAWRRENGEWKQILAAALKPGEEILIKSGERVPADGEILENHASIDESLLTGESKPVEKGPGDIVYAGTVVSDEALVCRVKQIVGNTRLAQITQVVSQTLNTKPPIQRLADRASAYFAVGILLTAMATFIGWWALSGDMSQALLSAVAVLVVACPCALGLATPLAITIALGRTSRAGILVRNPTVLETAGMIDKIAFDKTGTLTRGKLTVANVDLRNTLEITKEELLCRAAAVEQLSEHPIAKAIVDACQNQVAPVENYKTTRGLGVSAHIAGKPNQQIKVGTQSFFRTINNPQMEQQATRLAQMGETVVWVGDQNQVDGYISLRDAPNPSAETALRQLEADGIKTAMLSGDDPITVEAIANELNLDEFYGALSPTRKIEIISEWQRDDRQIAMAGDGVNDAPALAQSDLSITAAGGTDIAGETSDIVLMHSDLSLIPWFIALSRRTRRIIRENLGWAFAYNLVAVPLAAFGLISPVIAAVAMASSSLLVVGNSLRLRK
jgi:heavy metal translocating P-type ATPase